MIWVLIDVILNPEAAVLTYNSQKNEVFIKDFFSKCGQIPVNATKSAGTFAEEIFNGKLHFLCSEMSKKGSHRQNVPDQKYMLETHQSTKNHFSIIY